MKTFTKEEYIAIYPQGVLLDERHDGFYPYRWRLPPRHQGGFKMFCDCRRLEHGLNGFYEDCPNCDGEGVPPIPLEELK